jgi:hypothetical protein
MSKKKKKRPGRDGTVRYDLVLRFKKKELAFLLADSARANEAVTEYLRRVITSHIRQGIKRDTETIQFPTPNDALAAWDALNQTPQLTPPQVRLGGIMRGEL